LKPEPTLLTHSYISLDGHLQFMRHILFQDSVLTADFNRAYVGYVPSTFTRQFKMIMNVGSGETWNKTTLSRGCVFLQVVILTVESIIHS
jgi:hypothetical protein